MLRKYKELSGTSQVRLWLAAAALVLLLVLVFGGKPWHVDFTPGRTWKPGDYMRVYFWPAAAFNLAALGLLAWLAPLWTHPTPALAGRDAQRPAPRWFWPLVIGAAIFLGACTLPRLGQSLWHDEASRTKRTMVGEYRKPKESGGPCAFRAIKWERALFDSELPNHVLQSVLSKAAHDAWTTVAPPRGFQIVEAPMRIPSLLAGLGGVVILAVLLRALGSPGAGAAAAWLLALHPWYLRYAAEARGYAIVMALVPLLLLAFVRAVETGRTRWWVVFGLAQFGMVYAYVPSLYIPLVLNAAAPFVFWSLRKEGFPLLHGGAKWLVANLLSGMAFFQLFLPNAPQLLKYVDSEKGRGLGNVMDWTWGKNVLAHLWSGLPWTNTFSTKSAYLELLPQAAAHPAAFALGMAVSILLVLLGIAALARRRPFGLLCVLVFLLPATIYVVGTKLRGGFLYEWYVVYALVGLVALAAAGGGWIFRAAPRGALRATCAVLLAAAGLCYAAWTQPQRHWLVTRSVQPYREAVLSTRPNLDPNADGQNKILTAFFHAGPLVYDPRVIRCYEVKDIQAVVEEAEQSGKTLFFVLGYLDTTGPLHPSKYSLVARSGLFDEHAFFQGLQPSLSIRVFRYRHGSAKNFDFSAYPDDVPPSHGWMNYL